MWFDGGMPEGGYNQFCPVAKGAEIVATRWTPLILLQLMYDARSFNDIHRGVPLMSRALLASRLRQLEDDGIVTKHERRAGKGYEWRLTQSGDALRECIDAMGRWGAIYGRDRVRTGDRDANVLMWGLRRRVDRASLPPKRVVIRFDLSGVPRSRTGVRLYWLVLEPGNVDVCYKDPGFPVHASVAGDVAALIDVFMGDITWRDATSRALTVTGEREVVRKLPTWLVFDKRARSLPIVPPAA